ncbi:MAG: phage holin family protein [Verrucomicrobiota bacterium]
MGSTHTEKGSSSSIAGQVRTTARTFLAYFQVRAELFALECREAAEVYQRRALFVALCAVHLFFGYAILLICVIKLLSSYWNFSWVWVALGFSLLHFLAGFLLWRFRERSSQGPLFEASLQEFTKDQQWLSKNENKS